MCEAVLSLGFISNHHRQGNAQRPQTPSPFYQVIQPQGWNVSYWGDHGLLQMHNISMGCFMYNPLHTYTKFTTVSYKHIYIYNIVIVSSNHLLHHTYDAYCVSAATGDVIVRILFGRITKSYMALSMMTSSNGNIFRVIGHLCGELTGPRWIPRTKASDAELWCIFWSASE